MGLFDKVKAFLKSEADDIADMAGDARDKLDDELTRREAELAMTPAEKIDALQQKAAATDDEFDRIVDKAQDRAASVKANAEVDDLADAVSGGTAAADLEDKMQASSEQTKANQPQSATSANDRRSNETPAAKPGDEAQDRAALTQRSQPPEPSFEKTPAQLKYEEARESADKLLDELRGELRDSDG